MPRRSGGASELRQMLAAHHRERRERWDAKSVAHWERCSPETRGPLPEPSGPSEFERALLAGEDVGVSSGQLLSVLLWAGREKEAMRYRFDGPDYRTGFVLVGDRLERCR